MENANIEGYCKKVLGKNRPKSAIQSGGKAGKKTYVLNYMQDYNNQSDVNNNGDEELHYENSSVPDFGGDVLKKVPSANKNNNKRPTPASQQRPTTASQLNNTN
jgi:hypothetical protein